MLIYEHFYNVNNVKDIAYIKSFGNNLRKVRLSKQITQETLAYMSDIPISQIGRIERGEINTTISTAKVIAISLEMNPKDLFDF
jgi:transcriptional regulator with XRE-family HTH domain